MPHRLVGLGILLFWSIAAAALFVRDLLPDLMIGSPPALRSISMADRSPRPTRWTLMVVDEDEKGEFRVVGQAVTETTLKDDGWVRMSSEVRIDGEDLLRGTPFGPVRDAKLKILSAYEIDPSGNLQTFHAGVREADEADDLLSLDGRLKGDVLEVRARGPLPIFNWTRNFPYQPRGIVQNAVAPMDRMPGLRVGQRWESRIVSPLTGRVESVRVEVQRKGVITWGNNPVSALEVVARSAGLSVRIWVRPDGLVLRQEVPFPFGGQIVLERQPEAGHGPDGAGAGAEVAGP